MEPVRNKNEQLIAFDLFWRRQFSSLQFSSLCVLLQAGGTLIINKRPCLAFLLRHLLFCQSATVDATLADWPL